VADYPAAQANSLRLTAYREADLNPHSPDKAAILSALAMIPG
jgi:hypothetical protein